MNREEEILEQVGDVPPLEVTTLLGGVPGRWGRMTLLSRLLIIETGRILQESNKLEKAERLCDKGLTVGLIGATGRGSLYTDQAFKETMQAGPGLASPALFGYTLPNTPLAEAAVFYGLMGPVYALYDECDNKLEVAEKEASRLLVMQQELDFMLACEFDHYYAKERQEKLSVTLNVIIRDA